jgi:membrane-associated protease RseP (regulator of RpoE activity)
MQKPDRLWFHALLFALTFVSTMMAGTAWAMVDPTDISIWGHGLTFALLIMCFLTAHEFGHYIAARIHGVDATLPYFIPMPFILFGTMGAVIRTRSPIPNRRVLFDIGVAGPLAGFVVCLVILAIGYALPMHPDSLYQYHPEYRFISEAPTSGMYFGDIPLFSLFRIWGSSLHGWVPPMNEVYHYPFLCVGWFGLFVTALNMAPFGSLDGGHVLYSLVGGPIQRAVSRTLWWVMFGTGLLSVIGILDSFLMEPSPEEWVRALQYGIGKPLHGFVQIFPWLFQGGESWLIWALLVRFLVRIDHPEIPDDQPLGTTRAVIGWLAIVILLWCLPLRVIYEV